MAQCLFQRLPLTEILPAVCREAPLHESLPEKVDSLLRGVQHVGSIEAVVAQLVQHNFVGRKVASDTSLASTTSHTNNPLNGQEQGGFGELAFVIAVLTVTDGTHCQHHLHSRVMAAQQRDGLLQVVGTGLYREFLLLKEGGRALLTVVYNLAGLLEPIDMVGSQRQKDDKALATLVRLLRQPALQGMQNAGRVVHRAIGIDGNRKALFLKAPAHLVGKARPHEEHFLAWLHLKRSSSYLYFSPKQHLSYYYSLPHSSTPADLQTLLGERHLHEAGIGIRLRGI